MGAFYLDIKKFNFVLGAEFSDEFPTPKSKEDFICKFIDNCYEKSHEYFRTVLNAVLINDSDFALEYIILKKFSLFNAHKEKIIQDATTVYFSKKCILLLKNLQNRPDLVF